MDNISQQEQILSNARQVLKQRFFGIDSAIDQLIDKIRIWWCYPEYLFRPTIISMYGLTGVGKTELVHSLVRLLRMESHFCNIDLSNNDHNIWIESQLRSNNIRHNTQGILLIDEIQRFQGGPSVNFNGFWSLLSNGRLTSVADKLESLENLINMIQQNIRNRLQMLQDMIASGNTDPELMQKTIDNINKQPSIYASSGTVLDYLEPEDIPLLWQAKMHYQGPEIVNKDYTYMNSIIGNRSQLNAFAASIPEEALLLFFKNKYMQFAQQAKTLSDEDFIYKRLLIIINGNLDKLFIPRHLDKPEQALTCDDMTSHVSQITSNDIREHLFTIFRPEQVSRFGSNFIIFPALDLESYWKIIQNEVNKWINIALNQYKMDITRYVPLHFIFRLVTERGFFPSQGARPVISATNAVMGELMPELIAGLRNIKK